MRALVARLSLSGTTVLLSSHLLAEVEELCNRVAIVRTGRDRLRGRPGRPQAHRGRRVAAAHHRRRTRAGRAAGPARNRRRAPRSARAALPGHGGRRGRAPRSPWSTPASAFARSRPTARPSRTSSSGSPRTMRGTRRHPTPRRTPAEAWPCAPSTAGSCASCGPEAHLPRAWAPRPRADHLRRGPLTCSRANPTTCLRSLRARPGSPSRRLLLFGSFWLFPLITALVAGDIVAAEDRNGTLKTILTRSVGREPDLHRQGPRRADLRAVAMLLMGLAAVIGGIADSGFHPLVTLSGTT